MSDPRSAGTLPRPRPGTPPVPTVPHPERFTLSNGLRVVVVRRGELPQVAGRLLLPAGSAADPAGLWGTASLTGALLLEGTEAYAPLDLHGRIDALGAALDARVGHDFAEVDISLLAETLEEGLGLLAEVVVRPVFPDREIERVRAETLDALEGRLDEPANLADDAAAEAVFGAEHPYGRLPMGSVESVSTITRADLVAFHARHYRPEGSVLILAGDLGDADLPGLLQHRFGEWAGEAPRIEYPDDPERPVDAGTLARIEWPDSPQAEIRVAGLGMHRAEDDWIAAAVANYILGGSTITGRLGSNLREEKGWTYGVRSGFAAGVRSAGWVVETAVGAEVAEQALAEIEAEIVRMITEPVDAAELDRAKDALILSLPRAFETPGRIVGRLATLEAYGLPDHYWESMPNRVRSVDAETIRALADRYFSPGILTRVTVGPPLPIGPDGV